VDQHDRLVERDGMLGEHSAAGTIKHLVLGGFWAWVERAGKSLA